MPFKDKEKRREYHKEYMRGWYQENKAKHIACVRKRDKKIKDWLRENKINRRSWKKPLTAILTPIH